MIYAGVGNRQNKDGRSEHKPNYRRAARHCPRPLPPEPSLLFMCRLCHLAGVCTGNKRLKIAKPLPRAAASTARVEREEWWKDGRRRTKSIIPMMCLVHFTEQPHAARQQNQQNSTLRYFQFCRVGILLDVCLFETEGPFKVTGNYVHSKCGNISETVQDKVVVTTSDH